MVFISINRVEDPATVRGFVNRYKKTWPVLLDGDGKVFSRLIPGGVPSFVIIDRDGRLAYRQVGWSDELVDLFAGEIKRLQ